MPIKNIKYPKTNYIGNKEKLADWIVEELPIKSGKVLDLFSGGNSVSFALKRNDFEVHSNDALYASFVLSKAIVENKTVTLPKETIDEALAYNLTTVERAEFSWLDERFYFKEEVDELARLVKFSDLLSGYKKYLFQSLIRRSMIRKMPYSRLNIPWNNIVKLRNEDYSYEKYGRRRAYHNQPFSFHMKENCDSYNEAIFDNGCDNKSYQMDVFELLDEIELIDVVYIDPPYPGTMNKYNDFYGSFDRLFTKSIPHLNLTDKKQFLNNLEEIIKKLINKTSYIVLSMNSRSNPSICEMSDLMEKYGIVEIKEKKHNYQISGKDAKNKNYEALLILTL